MFKKFIQGISLSFLSISLTILAIVGATWFVFGTANNTKQAVEASGVYDGIVDSVLDSAANASKSEGEGNDLPIDQPEIQQAAQAALPPEFIQKNAETLIDGLFGWLSGTTEVPQFTVDVTAAKQKFIGGVGTYAKTRYEGLPPCSIEQLQTIDPNDIDALNIPCQSSYISGDMLQQGVEAKLTANEEFLKDTVFTGEDLPKNDQGQVITEDLEAAPTVYTAFQVLPWAIIVLILGLFGIILLTSERKRTAVRNTAIAFISTGGFLLVLSQVMIFLTNKINF